VSREQVSAPASALDAAQDAEAPGEQADHERRRWWHAVPSGLRYSLAVYAITRVPVVAGAALFLRDHPGSSVDTMAVTWDGYWYTHIARDGYSASLRSPVAVVGPDHHTLSDWAFFPGYPLLIRAVGWLTRMPLVPASIVLAAVVGALAVWAVYALGAVHGGVRVARGAALLFAAWPGAAVLNLPYTEGMFLAAAGAALVCLEKRRWATAGLLGAVASATRPTGLAVIAAATVAAALAILVQRQWRALLAPALAATGATAFVVYGWQRTGDLLVWRHAENLWRQRLDFNSAVVRGTVHLLGDARTAMSSDVGRTALATSLLRVLGVLVVAAMVAAAWANRSRLSLPLVAYAAVTLAMILGYSTVSTRPRMVLTVLPGFVWLAAWLPRRMVIALAVCLLALLGVVTYLWGQDVTP
jgi:hypothetical protein